MKLCRLLAWPCPSTTPGWGTFFEDTFVEGTLVEWNIHLN